jgi:hypothetical protein
VTLSGGETAEKSNESSFIGSAVSLIYCVSFQPLTPIRDWLADLFRHTAFKSKQNYVQYHNTNGFIKISIL